MNESTNQIALPKNEIIERAFSQANAFIGHAVNLTRDPDIAQDCFQEACLKFLTMPATFRAFPPAARYICKSIFSIAVDYMRKQSRFDFTDCLPEMICEPEIQWQKGMLLEKLREATDDLSIRECRLLTIYNLPGLKLREKSRLMKLPVSTYRYQVSKVISKLRTQLTKVKPQRMGSTCRKGGD